ncbi:MerR family transcriptional regulator [Flavihumibacter sp. ZG627]|uniref:MerR family transcriptional regulator n=1 Tax=Flavihumibacter sp. ZG627 TaxID=1463156 RepID=UPI00057FA3BE|nr:MerR family transcriptional regulator [Flavihumibacter sp. ZG627]KIC92298.1 MerR family transcriptional regulator [Flavihumibacter sp. ZG627]
MNAFTIKDLENLSGIKAHTIRIWEQRYNFLKPQRTETNIRYYSTDELKSILNIALLNKYGYKISHIDKMHPGEIRDRILTIGNAQAQQERIVNELIQHMVDMNIEDFEAVLDTYITARGVDKTITQVIFPFLEKIGILWMTNHINPAQEHLVTNIIRQKLIVGIEGAFSHVRINKTVLLFMPEGEHHEIGLLFTYYLLKSKGVNVLYMGANLPLKDVEFVANLKQPDFLYTHLTSVAANFNFERFLTNYHNRCGSHKLVVSGLLTQQYKKKVPESVTFKLSLPAVMEFIAALA